MLASIAMNVRITEGKMMPTSEPGSVSMTPRSRQARTLSEMSELRLEVRAMSRRAHRIALSRSSEGNADYRSALRDLFEAWLNEATDHALVICLASAAEFGVPVHGHADRCRSWIARQCSSAVRALYWAAANRLRAHCRVWTTVPKLQNCLRSQGPTAEVSLDHRKSATVNRARLCESCEALLTHSRCSLGHASLRPDGKVTWHHGVTGTLFHTSAYKCGICQACWKRHQCKDALFASWDLTEANTAAVPMQDASGGGESRDGLASTSTAAR